MGYDDLWTHSSGSGKVRRAAERAGPFSKEIRRRLSVLDWHANHGKNFSLTARHFEMDRGTVKIWYDRLTQKGPAGLLNQSSRPHRLRMPGVGSTGMVNPLTGFAQISYGLQWRWGSI